jgi:hypothetical protein
MHCSSALDERCWGSQFPVKSAQVEETTVAELSSHNQSAILASFPTGQRARKAPLDGHGLQQQTSGPVHPRSHSADAAMALP